MRESTFTLVYWGFIPSFPTKGQLDNDKSFIGLWNVVVISGVFHVSISKEMEE